MSIRVMSWVVAIVLRSFCWYCWRSCFGTSSKIHLTTHREHKEHKEHCCGILSGLTNHRQATLFVKRQAHVAVLKTVSGQGYLATTAYLDQKSETVQVVHGLGEIGRVKPKFVVANRVHVPLLKDVAQALAHVIQVLGERIVRLALDGLLRLKPTVVSVTNAGGWKRYAVLDKGTNRLATQLDHQVLVVLLLGALSLLLHLEL